MLYTGPFIMKRTATILSFLLMMLTATFAGAQGAAGPVSFQPNPDLQRRVNLPTPGPGATNQVKKAAIGHGKAAIDTGDPKNSSWSETIDISGAGQVVNADLLWDGSSKILYAFGHATLRCTHGKTTEGDILIGVYGKKNFLGKPAGSGWWVVELQQGQCEAPLAGLYGCKFGVNGDPVACGRAELDPRINDMAIVEATRF
jgi:hypothetical protein